MVVVVATVVGVVVIHMFTTVAALLQLNDLASRTFPDRRTDRAYGCSESQHGEALRK